MQNTLGDQKDGPIDIIGVNDVRVHTPIHAELTLTPNSTNQLVDGSITLKGSSKLARTNKLITLGDEFTATLNVQGKTAHYWYPDQRGWYRRMLKYIKEATITCGFCGQTYDVTYEVKNTGKATHNCRAWVDENDDLTEKCVTAKVVAENAGTGTGSGMFNAPDSEYILERKEYLSIIGKIYGLQVRAVDDGSSWKLSTLQDLSLLPAGEKEDNKNQAYKNGLSLGWRAYFDLKTLGSASKTIEIKPKIYYIDENGRYQGEIGQSYQLWYKNGSANTAYELLDNRDISIDMSVVTTNPDEFNNDSSNEMSLMKEFMGSYVNYALKKSIGGLKQISLGTNNAVATKYSYKQRTSSDSLNVSSNQVNGGYTSPINKSRRWYGEVYLPASTRIIATGAGNYTTNKTNIINGNYIKKGYLLVLFDTIKTTSSTTSGTTSYLSYEAHMTPEFTIASGSSQLTVEKKGKSSITLPNGTQVTNLPSLDSDAPMIIYDLSLKANDSYEQSGTQ